MNAALQTDFLVIGSGIAGLCYALEVAQHGEVTIVTKKHSAESNTNYAQGGIAAVMSAQDSFESHIADTLSCGAGLCDRAVVEMVVREGPQRIRELVAMGARFSQTDGELHLGREGGHSAERIVHTADATGREIERTLLQQVQEHPRITMLEYHYAMDLNIAEGRCTGAILLDEQSGETSLLVAKAVLLASGGSGQVYLHTTNPAIATGDGVAMAWRAGAAVANMEFFQFHPTTLYHPEGDSFLISEAVRGAGGILTNQAGERFMLGAHPQAELAPRDIVARAIDEQLKTRNEDFVWLDISRKPRTELLDHFPTIYETCLRYGIDITRQPIPVVPAAHYQCGGVMVDRQARTGIAGLFACGEVTYTGLHGANRLASNSLLEALVFSHHAAEASIAYAAAGAAPIAPHPPLRNESKAWPDHRAVEALRHRLRCLMSAEVGIVRSNRRLKRARKELAVLQKEATRRFGACITTVELCELRNLLTVSGLIIESALQRQESRGLHYLQDCPQSEHGYLTPTILGLRSQ